MTDATQLEKDTKNTRQRKTKHVSLLYALYFFEGRTGAACYLVRVSRLASHSVGYRLKQAREKRGYTMAAVAQLADVSASSINQIEKGTNQPRGDTIEKLARVLRVSPSWLMYQEGSKPDWDT